MWIGAHVPTRGGLQGAIESARSCGAEAAQIWGSNPRAWAHPHVPTEAARRFGQDWREAGLGPLFLHAPYMVNVASPDPGFRRRSVDLARATVALAEAIGAAGVVVHAGSAGPGSDRAAGLERATSSLTSIAGEAETSFVLVELMAGTSGSVASTFPEARVLFDAAGMHPRLALCADTCHLFGAGYALAVAEGVAACFADLRRAGLARRLRLIHANDARHPRGSRRDGHANIGLGHIGEVGFRAILAQPAVRRCAVICETPGRAEDHARDIANLKLLAEGSGFRRARRRRPQGTRAGTGRPGRSPPNPG
jgi:deoxyribonuclease IV